MFANDGSMSMNQLAKEYSITAIFFVVCISVKPVSSTWLCKRRIYTQNNESDFIVFRVVFIVLTINSCCFMFVTMIFVLAIVWWLIALKVQRFQFRCCCVTEKNSKIILSAALQKMNTYHSIHFPFSVQHFLSAFIHILWIRFPFFPTRNILCSSHFIPDKQNSIHSPA